MVPADRSLVTIASRTCLITADLIVIGVTWYATYHTTQLVRMAGQESMRTFSGTILRDGTLCFAMPDDVALWTNLECSSCRHHIFPVSCISPVFGLPFKSLVN